MLEVHPPHEPTRSWKDFLLHIATIVVGLFISVSLEQTVEYLHHWYQVRETRETLRVEEEQNGHRFTLETKWFKLQVPLLRTDIAILRYLRLHPHASPQNWPGQFDWRTLTMTYNEAAWKAAQQDGVIEHMPAVEVQRTADLYMRLETIQDEEFAELRAMEEARGFLLRDPDPSHLTPVEMDKAIADMTKVFVALVRSGSDQERLTRRYPNFGVSPTKAELDDLLGIQFTPQQAAAFAEANREFAETDHLP